MVAMLTDPPELAQEADRGDPPIELWPGKPTTKRTVMQACGDPRDWFRYGHRLEAFEQVWTEFADARARRRDFMSGFDWNQILIIGRYGSGKTTIALNYALPYMRRGHPIFSQAGMLVGWHLERDESYTAMARGPKCGLWLNDEASSSLAGRVAHGIAVTSTSETNLNTRKQNSIVMYMTAQDRMLAPSIRRECKEVWKAVPRDELLAGMPVRDMSTGEERPLPAEDPDNFRIAYYVWDDFPYEQADIIDGQKISDGFGPPSYTAYDEGENVRLAYLLTDTFQLAQPGFATLADRDNIKEDMAAIAEGRAPVDRSEPQADDRLLRFLGFLQENEYDPPEFFRAAAIGAAIGANPAQAGSYVQQTCQVYSVPKKGYPSEQLYDWLDRILEGK